MPFDISLFSSLFPLLWLYKVLIQGVLMLGVVSAGGGGSDDGMDLDEDVAFYATSIVKGYIGKEFLHAGLELLEAKMPQNAVFYIPLGGNSAETEAELDVQVRKAFKKSPRVHFSKMWYSTETSNALLDPKAGIVMRNVGLDFVFFGNVWDIIAHMVPNADACALGYSSELALSSKDLKTIAQSIRKKTGAKAVVGLRLFKEGVPSTDYLFRIINSEVQFDEKVTVTIKPAEEQHFDAVFHRIYCCGLCLAFGPNCHAQAICPKMTSINKIRDRMEYGPITWDASNNGWVRRDIKMVKSVEVRVEALEKEMSLLKTKVGTLEAASKPNPKKRKAEEQPKEEKEGKKQKGKAQEEKKEEAKAQAKPPAQAEGEKPKKKRKRGGKKKKEGEEKGKAAS
ncbi:hypothetical protein BDM02DRAFT_3133183 [Thelephora ganbajun]|uniref:Uncharacterized protein n=1 Tax=Thelephora ganbajun TaxID=370292 RepID=A0ACB6YXZ8_THEGA|nr:hypothetical protein BDM02DRAFT_3133183 [Thelephora ganbajun]